jgi:hypothetical protein
MNSSFSTRYSFKDFSHYPTTQPDNNLCFETPPDGLVSHFDCDSNSIQYFQFKTNQTTITITFSISNQFIDIDNRLKSQKFKKRTSGHKKDPKVRIKGNLHLHTNFK